MPKDKDFKPLVAPRLTTAPVAAPAVASAPITR